MFITWDCGIVKEMAHEYRREEFTNESEEGKLIGGAIMIFIGIVFLLVQSNIIDLTTMWPIIPSGIGALLILNGLSKYRESGSLDRSIGFFIGGSCMIFFTAGISLNFVQWWPILIIGIGLFIIFRGRR